ncbi:MAG TPA: retropepsin-like aspartic protease [Candidatus Tectomicrobia bacterium]
MQPAYLACYINHAITLRDRVWTCPVCHAVYWDAPQGYGNCAMSIPFNPQHGLVIVRAAVDGTSGSAVLRLALDTGATGTVLNVGMLVALGYDPALVPERIQVTTGSGVELVPRVSLHKIVALGQERTNFPVLGHTLPPSGRALAFHTNKLPGLRVTRII